MHISGAHSPVLGWFEERWQGGHSKFAAMVPLYLNLAKMTANMSSTRTVIMAMVITRFVAILAKGNNTLVVI
jgi:hypothetical protein